MINKHDYEIIYRCNSTDKNILFEKADENHPRYQEYLKIDENADGDINPYSQKGFPYYSLDDSIEGKIFGYKMCLKREEEINCPFPSVNFYVRGENKEQSFIIARNIIGTMKLKLNLDPSIIIKTDNE